MSPFIPTNTAMAIKKRAYIKILNIKEGNALNHTVLLTGYDLTDKELAMDVKSQLGSTPVLKFTTEDDSIETNYNDSIPAWEITFKKTSLEMKIRPDKYILDVEAYTSDTDTETFADGEMEIIPKVTSRIK